MTETGIFSTEAGKSMEATQQTDANTVRNIAIILAGGKGNRLGSSTPKQFLTISGLTVLERSVAAFERNAAISETAIVAAPEHHAEIRTMTVRNGWRKVRHIISGGKERSDSSLSAIRTFEGETANLVFHDAARPLVTDEIITGVCEALTRYEAVGTGIPSVDTVMEVSDGIIRQVPDRRLMQRMQTPQAFRLPLIAEAYRRALADPGFRATDDCGVVLRYLPETPVHVVPGDPCNLKITFPEDLKTAERLLAGKSPAAHSSVSPEKETSTPQSPNATAESRNRYVRRYHGQHLREMQLAELDILREVSKVCERHRIPFWLDSGTLLGAVRHGGFIPWDDDIDICMPLEEVTRFVKAAQAELPPHLFVQTPTTDPQLRLPICKVRNLNSLIVEGDDDFSKNYAKGLYIDIFPMHDWPSFPYKLSKRLARGYCRANAILQTQHTYSLRSAAELFYFGAKRALFRAVWTAGSIFAGKGKYYSNTLDNSGNGNRHLRSSVFPLSSVTFEGERFPAPHDTDAYLRDLFGEYMTLPPEDRRQGHATFFLTRLA